MRHHLVLAIVAAALLAALLAPAGSARAYSAVLLSDPPDGALLGAGPTTVRLWFNHAVALPADRVQLVRSDGAVLAAAAVRVESYFPQRENLASQFDENYLFLCAIGVASWPSLALIELPELPAGAYRLSWSALGHEDRQASAGMLTFGVDPARAAPQPLAPRSLSQQVDDLLVSFAVEPNRPGATFLTVRVADLRRPAAAPVERVTLSLRPAAGGPALTLPAIDQGGGRYQALGASLPTAGDWHVQVRVSRPGLVDAVSDLVWQLPPAAPTAAGGAPLGGLLLGGLAAGGLAATLLLRRRRADGVR